MIHIKKIRNNVTLYSIDGSDDPLTSPVLCEHCESIFLDYPYVNIIMKIKHEDLLPKSYKMLCCECFILKTIDKELFNLIIQMGCFPICNADAAGIKVRIFSKITFDSLFEVLEVE